MTLKETIQKLRSDLDGLHPQGPMDNAIVDHLKALAWIVEQLANKIGAD